MKIIYYIHLFLLITVTPHINGMIEPHGLSKVLEENRFSYHKIFTFVQYQAAELLKHLPKMPKFTFDLKNYIRRQSLYACCAGLCVGIVISGYYYHLQKSNTLLILEKLNHLEKHNSAPPEEN